MLACDDGPDSQARLRPSAFPQYGRQFDGLGTRSDHHTHNGLQEHSCSASDSRPVNGVWASTLRYRRMLVAAMIPVETRVAPAAPAIPQRGIAMTLRVTLPTAATAMAYENSLSCPSASRALPYPLPRASTGNVNASIIITGTAPAYSGLKNHRMMNGAPTNSDRPAKLMISICRSFIRRTARSNPSPRAAAAQRGG